MKADAKALHQAVKNASLFAKKGGWADAVMVEHHVGGGLSFVSCDDYVGIDSRVDIGTERQLHEGLFYLSPQSIKDLEKWLRDVDGDCWVTTGDNQFHVDIGKPDEVLHLDVIECPSEDWWNMFDYVMQNTFVTPRSQQTFEISPDRLTQLSRLEPKGEYPLSLGHCVVGEDERRCVAFRYGPDTLGMIMPLDREALKKAYGDKLKEVVW